MAEVTTSQLLAEMKPAWRAALGDRVSHEWSRKDGSLMRRTCPPDLPTAEAAKQYRDALRSGQGFEALP